MSPSKLQLDSIPEAEKTPWVVRLLHYVQELLATLDRLKEEVARLKGHKGKPKVPPSRLERDAPGPPKEKAPGEKRPGSQKRSKTKTLTIHETIPVEPEAIPSGSAREGHDEWVVQGLIIKAHNVCYQLQCWRTPEGRLVKGKLPKSVNGHFDATLTAYVQYQHYQMRATQPLILEELREFGIDLSSGQINRMLTEDKEEFHQEKRQILEAGLETAKSIHVDDTGARHAGKNGYCTHIGNELFAWFESTASKSRLNFLALLNPGHAVCALNADAFDYLQRQSFPQPLLALLSNDDGKLFATQTDWAAHLGRNGIVKERHVRIATEGARLASLLHHGLSRDLLVMSDDAGQFNVLSHILCWIHAERTIHKLVPSTQKETKDLSGVRDGIWKLYRGLKDYKLDPKRQERDRLEKQFDDLFATQTGWTELDNALQRLARNKRELLVVLDRPDAPLNNNLSERDIRERAQTRKVSGGTRSDDGRRCRDTFSSLKKTCRKLGVSFWAYLHDRLAKENKIPPLPDLIRARAQSP